VPGFDSITRLVGIRASVRLRRSNPHSPGFTRRRSGAGFAYFDTRGRRLTDRMTIKRIKALVIPPAWRDVWICPDPAGHIQAIGVDAAGRRQYLYHSDWRARRDRRKFHHVVDVAASLRTLRRHVTEDLNEREPSRHRALALAARLIDRGLFRVGGEEYAGGDEPTYGVATLECRHVTCHGARIRFHFDGKGGVEHELAIEDAGAARVVRSLLRVREPSERLLAYRAGDEWKPVRSSDINRYLTRTSGVAMTAKDLRTWHATVMAASALARSEPGRSPTQTRRVVARVVGDVANDLGNTPAVARASYIDPRVVSAFENGKTIDLPANAARSGPAAEEAVREMLDP
jgi:DNA topoisomerase I